jgi:hypothetical protein
MQSRSWLDKRMLTLGLYLFSIGLLIGSAAATERGYQDTWILEGVLPHLILVLIAFVLYVWNEPKTGFVALAVTGLVLTLRLVAGLKYLYPYGVALDQGTHLANLRAFVETGMPEAKNVYSNEPGMYIALFALDSFNDLSPTTLMRLAPAVITSVMPLVVYVLGKSLRLSESALRFTTLSSVLAIDPYFAIFQGSMFGPLLLGLLLMAIVSREVSKNAQRRSWSILVVSILCALTVTHAITSLLAVVLLPTVGLILTTVSSIRPNVETYRNMPRSEIVWSGVLAFVLVFSWWMYRSDLVFDAVIRNISELVASWGNPTRPPIPSKFLSLSILDQAKIVVLYHADFLLVVALTTPSMWIVMKHPRWRILRESNGFRIVLVTAALLGIFLLLQMILRIGQIEYFRIISYIVVVAPPLIAPVNVEWARLLYKELGGRRYAWISGLSFFVLIAVALVQAFPYQPMVPKSSFLETRLGVSEPIVHMHSVLSDRQISMLRFAGENRSSTDMLGADIVTHNTAVGIWGIDRTRESDLERSVSTRPLDDGKWTTLLTHRPGLAGPLYEQAEFRVFALTNPLEYPVGYSVLYDNGGSFVVSR